MPRSKRKAAAARSAANGVAQDFVRKKTRLGKRKTADNATNTSFKSKQIYIPVQGRQELPEEHKTGLTLQELLTRAGHYNANTRLAAFNAITKSLDDRTTSAFAQAHAQAATVLSTALNALQDDLDNVRAAALATLVAVLDHLRSVRPFARLISAQILACLSHIRVDIRLHAAKALSAILCIPNLSALDIFQLDGPNPLEALSDLLGAVTKSHSRSIALEAIASVCNDESSGGRAKITSTFRTPSSFFFHRRPSLQVEEERAAKTAQLLQKLTDESASNLLVKIVYIVTECFPMTEVANDVGKKQMLSMAAKALQHVACHHSISCTSEKPLQRALDAWAKERNRESAAPEIQAVHLSLAEAALANRRFDMVAQYLRIVLGSSRKPPTCATQSKISSQIVSFILRFFEACPARALCDTVANAWVEKWLLAAKGGDISYIALSVPVLKCVLQQLLPSHGVIPGPSNAIWRVMEEAPKLARMSVSERLKMEAQLPEGDDSRLERENSMLVYIACENALLHEVGCVFRKLVDSSNEELQNLAESVVEALCDADTITHLGNKGLEELLSILYNSRVLIRGSVLRVMIEMCLSKDSKRQDVGQSIVSVVESFVVEEHHSAMKNDSLALLAALQVVESHLSSREREVEGELFAQISRILRMLS